MVHCGPALGAAAALWAAIASALGHTWSGDCSGAIGRVSFFEDEHHDDGRVKNETVVLPSTGVSLDN